MEQDVRRTQWNLKPCLASKPGLRCVVFERDNLGAQGCSAERGEDEARTRSSRARRPRSTHVRRVTRIAGKSLKNGGFISLGALQGTIAMDASSQVPEVLSSRQGGARAATNSILKRVLPAVSPRSLSSASYRLSMWYLSAFSAW